MIRVHPFYGPSRRLVSGGESGLSGLVSMAAYLAFWAAALVVARRELDRRWPVAPRGGSGSDAALGVLRERFARGELDEAQYRAMVGVLAGGSGRRVMTTTASRGSRLAFWAGLAWFGVSTVLFRRRDPIVGSLIVTDRCNLNCRHCAVANLRKVDYPFETLRRDLRRLHAEGVRLLLLYGGEPLLWHDGELTLRDVIAEARAIGFGWVGVVTNGTRGVDLPEADLVLVSLDGMREHHDAIRGRTFDRVVTALQAADTPNLCLYMAVNRENLDDLEDVTRLAGSLPAVRGVSFNLHTPYPGTEALALDPQQRREVCARIGTLIRDGHPVLNLASALPRIADLSAPRPCPQCVVVEDGEQWSCGRCIEIPGLCEQCGFSFAAELSLLFRGSPAVVAEVLRRYPALLLSGRRARADAG